MEMDSYKSQILDGVLMVLVQKQYCTSPCLESYSPCLNLFGTNIHIPAYLGSRGKPFFWNSEVFFIVSADRRFVQICTLICIIQTCSCEITYKII